MSKVPLHRVHATHRNHETIPLFPFDDWDHHFNMMMGSHETLLGRVEHRESADAHVFRADLPGLKREDVSVQVEDGRVLKITGEKRVAREDKFDNNWYRVESSSDKFFSAFTLPENARVDQVRSKMENGVLTVTVPKRDKAHTFSKLFKFK